MNANQTGPHRPEDQDAERRAGVAIVVISLALLVVMALGMLYVMSSGV